MAALAVSETKACQERHLIKIDFMQKTLLIDGFCRFNEDIRVARHRFYKNRREKCVYCHYFHVRAAFFHAGVFAGVNLTPAIAAGHFQLSLRAGWKLATRRRQEKAAYGLFRHLFRDISGQICVS